MPRQPIHWTIWHLTKNWPEQECLGQVHATDAKNAVDVFCFLNNRKNDGTYIAKRFGKYDPVAAGYRRFK